MEFLKQAARRRDSGESLPPVFKVLEEHDVRFYRGSVVLVAAAPGVGKSTLVLNYTLRARVPSLYVCMDTPRKLTVVRSVQTLRGLRQYEAESELEDPESKAWQMLADTMHLASFFRGSAQIQDVECMLGAYAEITGSFPQLVIVDNLVNMEREYAEQFQLMSDLDAIAKAANICIMVLTHVKGEYVNGTKQIPLNGIVNQITQFPHTVLTLHREDGDESLLHLTCVKNRTGPYGLSNMYTLHSDFSTMRITG